MASFSKKAIETHITLAAGSFGGQGNKKIIRNLATEVGIEKPGLPDKNSASVIISGMKYDDIAQLTTLNFAPDKNIRKNLIEIHAGEEGGTLSMVYSGEIVSAYGDFNAAPDPALTIEALTGYYPDITAEGPSSYKGQVKISDVIDGLAQKIGYAFENQGAEGSLRNAILNGSPYLKMLNAAAQVGAALLIDDRKVVLLPAGKPRRTKAVVLRDDSGLLGYPTFTQDGIVVEALFDPAFEYGGVIQVRSIVPKASGLWRITKLSHELSTATSGPAWRSAIEAAFISET